MKIMNVCCVANFFQVMVKKSRYAFVHVITCSILLSAAGCGAEHIRNNAEVMSRAGHYEDAVKKLEEGVASYPENAPLRGSLANARIDALTQLLSQAEKAKSTGQLDYAENLIKRAEPYDAGSKRTAALLEEIRIQRRQNEILAQANELVSSQQSDAALKLVAEGLKDNPRYSGLLALKRKLEVAARQAQIRGAKLGLAESRPISLDFRDANLRTVLDVITRNSGVSFILDKDIRPDVRVTVYLKSVRFEDALDLVTSTNQLAKKVLDERTVLIYPNTPEKQREYQEQVVEVFYLASGDVKGAAAFLKSMLKMHDPFIDERTNMLALRESPEVIQLAERLIPLFDAPAPEVLLEVEIVEIDTNKLTNLGLQYPGSFTLSPLPLTGQTGLTLSSLRGLPSDRIGVSTPNLTLNVLKQVGDINILANPRIRARNNEKAKILIGDKVPVISATVGINGFVTDSVAYQDVGLKLDVEPTVYPDDEVAIKIALEVSTLGAQLQTSNGTTAYQISTRDASTVLRLHDGETQLLAGLINRQDSSSSSRIPGLGDFPVLGKLFGSQLDKNDRTELVLSITPHVLRNIRHPDATETELWVGTDSDQRIRSVGGRAQQIGSSNEEIKPNTVATPNLTTEQKQLPVTKVNSADVDGASVSNVTSNQPNVPIISPSQSQPDDLSNQKASDLKKSDSIGKIKWVIPAEVKVGDVGDAQLLVQEASGIRTLPLNVSYPKSLLEIVSVDQGENPGVTAGFSRQIDGTNGIVRLNALYPAGINGNASLSKIKFKALKSGIAELAVTSGDAANGQVDGSGIQLPTNIKVVVKP